MAEPKFVKDPGMKGRMGTAGKIGFHGYGLSMILIDQGLNNNHSNFIVRITAILGQISVYP
jgi:hypothetical protein